MNPDKDAKYREVLRPMASSKNGRALEHSVSMLLLLYFVFTTEESMYG